MLNCYAILCQLILYDSFCFIFKKKIAKISDGYNYVDHKRTIPIEITEAL